MELCPWEQGWEYQWPGPSITVVWSACLCTKTSIFLDTFCHVSFSKLPASTNMSYDKQAVWEFCINNYFIEENKVLEAKVRHQEDLLESYAEVVSERNRTIANLSAIIADLRRQIHEPIRRLVDQHGRTGYFSRGRDGVFRELEVVEDEPTRSVRRRLNFEEEDSDSDIEDEFTRMLFDV